MLKIAEFILRGLSDRKSHIDLQTACIEPFEGPILHGHAHRAVLALFLNTTIAKGSTVCALHACNNRKCINPKHMYWGTLKENSADYKASPHYVPFNERVRLKHGNEAFKRLQTKAGAIGGKGNVGKPKTYECGGSKKGRKRTWDSGSRKGIKMPRYWNRRPKKESSCSSTVEQTTDNR